MKKAALTLLTVAVLATPLLAAPAEIEDPTKGEANGVFTSILRIILKWVFPVGAAYCFLHGIIGKGVKRGEWDMAAICTIAAIALALFPKLLGALFGIDINQVLS